MIYIGLWVFQLYHPLWRCKAQSCSAHDLRAVEVLRSKAHPPRQDILAWDVATCEHWRFHQPLGARLNGSGPSPSNLLVLQNEAYGLDYERFDNLKICNFTLNGNFMGG